MGGYFHPLRRASATPGRVDQGVDFRNCRGMLVAIADCTVIESYPAAWSPYGGFVSYRITERGPLNGVAIYYAEGVSGFPARGERISGGVRVVDLVPDWGYGIEIGLAAGYGAYSWSRAHDGTYGETYSTAAGVWFNRLLRSIGGPVGVQYATVRGQWPPYSTDVHGGTAPAPPIEPVLPGGGGGPPPGDVGAAIRSAWAPWGAAGRQAYDRAHTIRALLDRTIYISEDGAQR